MRGKNIVNINGRSYDAITGMPLTAAAAKAQAAAVPSRKTVQSAPPRGRIMSDIVAKPATKTHKTAAKPASPQPTKPARQTAHASKVVHRRQQRSQTLQRSGLAKPAIQAKPAAITHRRSDMISRFAPQTAASSPHAVKKPQIAPKHTTAPQNAHHHHKPVASHTVHQAAHTLSKPVSQPKTPAKTGQELKEHLINTRMQETEAGNKKNEPHHKKPRLGRRFHARSVVVGVAAMVVLGGYLTYLNLPSLSIRVAASRADVNASYPAYRPAGYSFAGPVAFSPGQVRVNFKSNTNDYNYALVQRSSNWDSQAVLDNYVTPETDQYATLQERGLTIFIMPDKAAWVNGGTLYVIEGDAPLSSEQIQKIASSTL